MTEHTRPSAFRLNLMFLGSDAEKAMFGLQIRLDLL